jgi:lycopene cyclase domain-containing protein
MTYFSFLIIFLGAPLLILAGLTIRDWRGRRSLPIQLRNWPAWLALTAHAVVALVYTTPWDNYLIASGVWWYDPALVSGIVLVWVPLEEYLFFILQPIVAGLWLLFLARRLPVEATVRAHSSSIRLSSTLVAGLLWLGAVATLVGLGWAPGTYLALILGWALPPIILQLAFGADILWRHRRLLLLTLASVTLYLSAADALAIASGTWTINPALSLQIYLGGILPLEEFIFFLVTNILLGFGMVLVLARQSQERLETELTQRSLKKNSTGRATVDQL